MFEFEEQLSQEEQEELLKNKEDPQIKEKLIIHNLKLVYWFAKKYQKPDTPGRELEDLFQEGTLGLMAAIEDYNSDKGAFGAYAALHIRGSIFRAITNKQRVIRIPSHMVESINQYRKVKRSLEKTLERTPTQLEMSRKLNISIDKVNEIESLLHDPISLNAIIGGEDNDITLEDAIPDDGPSIENQVESNVFIEQFLKEFETTLPEAQFISVRLYYGLGCREHTLKEISTKLDISLSYAREERNKALRKIRRSKFIRDIYKSHIERELDDRTSYIRGIDYSQPRVSGGQKSSQVERLVLERERLLKEIIEE